MNTNPTQYNSIDVAKMTAAIFVVAIHCEPFTGIADTIILGLFGNLAVPFFFTTSSFFFFRKPSEKQNIRKFTRRLLTLYAIWFAIELPITVLHSFIEPQRTFTINLAIFMRDALLHSTFRGSWYITALVESVTILYLLRHRMGNAMLLGIGTIAYIITLLSSEYAPFLPAQLYDTVTSMNSLLGSAQMSVLGGLLPCAIGKYIAERSHENATATSSPGKLWAGFAITMCLMAVNRAFLPIAVALLFSAVKQTRVEWHVNYRSIRAYSTLFYFSHFIFVFIAVIVNKHFVPIHPMVKYAIVLLCCYIFSYAILRLERNRQLTWLKYMY